MRFRLYRVYSEWYTVSLFCNDDLKLGTEGTCAPIESIDPLQYCPWLRDLCMTRNEHLTTIKALFKCKHLQNVDLTGCDNVPTNEIKQLSKIIQNWLHDIDKR